MSGSEVVGPLSAGGIFTLTYSGASGSVARSVAVAVTPLPAPVAGAADGRGCTGSCEAGVEPAGFWGRAPARVAGAVLSDTDANVSLRESEWGGGCVSPEPSACRQSLGADEAGCE
jgi:hypothetical protein